MTKADVFLIISQVFIAVNLKDNKLALNIFATLWFVWYLIVMGLS